MIQITFHPQNKTVKVKKGTTILSVALKERVSIRHKCGGKGSCTTCKVKLSGVKNDVSPPRPAEIQRLGQSMLDQGFRLACQTRIFGTVEAEVPVDPLQAAVQARLNFERNRRENNDE